MVACPVRWWEKPEQWLSLGIKKAAGDMRHKMARIEEWFILVFIFLSYIYAVVQFVIFVG
ncbi:TPA: hypothetical protein J1Y96_003502 [Escherichia coli]|nr:hypothetical protein D3P02_15915 [Escherichia coli]KUS78269.1 hypothetical protein AWE77_23720 [Escherichia coli]HBA7758452.1 hypothetical protein [Escherichia coli]